MATTPSPESRNDTFTRDDIAAKGPHYKTARIRASGEFVALAAFDPRLLSFDCKTRLGRQWFNWRELDSFCL